MIKKLLFLGKYEPLKGFDVLLESLPRLKNNNWTLTVGGQNWNQEKGLLKLSEQQREKIIFLGHVQNDSVPALMKSHDLLIVPSHYENFGYVIAEAQASGLAVIGSFNGGIRSNIIDGLTGLHFQTRNPNDLAYKIDYLLDNSSKIKELGANGKIYAAQYDYNKVLDIYDSVFTNLANKN